MTTNSYKFVILFTFLLLAVLIISYSVAGQEVLFESDPSGLVSYWSLDDAGNTAEDSAGGNNGAVSGGAWTNGKTNGGMNFDGAAFIDIDSPALSGKWSVSLWVKRNSDSSSASLFGAPGRAIKLEQWYNTHAVGLTEFGVADAAFGYTSPIAVWTFLTLTSNGAETRLYANGLDQGAIAGDLDFNFMHIGKNVAGAPGDDYLNAVLDEIKLYDFAMTSTEVYDHFIAEGGVAVAAPNLDFTAIIPKPVSATETGGSFELTALAAIYVEAGSPEITVVGQYLANKLNPATGFDLQVIETSAAPAAGNIYLVSSADSALGDEGYQLDITSDGTTLSAFTPEGLFRGVQTIRQLFPANIEATTLQSGPWTLVTGNITDYPRMSYRGYMLDVARHFFTVAEVKSLIDQMALYKLNVFHFHLTDDQGWRIEIPAWPKLTTVGSLSEVGNGNCVGCFYSLAEFDEIVAYADARYIMVVPEIESPGHIRAALDSYPDELSCDGDSQAVLCFSNPEIYTFFGDVIAEIAPRINGPYIHMGGDEIPIWVSSADYQTFVVAARDIIASHGKYLMGWTDDIGEVTLGPDVTGQHWNGSANTLSIANQGGNIVMSPASRIYLDLKYNTSTPIGLTWAGYNDTKDAYSWDPAAQVGGVGENSLLGIEAPLWGETIRSLDDAEFLTFPRLIGSAEIGWTPEVDRLWDDYKTRLAQHGLRMDYMGINYYRSPLVPWPGEPPFSGTIFIDPDIITDNDPTTFSTIEYAGTGERLMFDRRSGWVTLEPFLFNVTFDDGLTTEVQVNPEFEIAEAAAVPAEKYARAVGRIPTALRADMETMWIHKGFELFGGGNKNVLIHTDQADVYAANGILHETLVHEASHTSIDVAHSSTASWLAAQDSDPAFISTYARDNPNREDIAESMMAYIAVRYRSDRISADLKEMIESAIPARIAYFDAQNFDMYPISRSSSGSPPPRSTPNANRGSRRYRRHAAKFIPIKSSAATGSDAPGSCVGHSRFPSPNRGYLSSTDAADL